MQITYLLDPLCGWCYGASPALERLAEREGVRFNVAPTGLFAGDGARRMDAGFAAYAWQNDQRIARLTGQPFSETYRTRVLGAAGAIFDSGPATLGIIAVSLTDPSRELFALKALQHARYVDGRDTATLDVVAEVLHAASLPQAAGLVRTPDERLLAAYRQRIEAARTEMIRFGADGVPTLIVDCGSGRRVLPSNALYGRFDLLFAQLRAA